MRPLLSGIFAIGLLLASSSASAAEAVSPELSKTVSETTQWLVAPNSSAAPAIATKSVAISLDRVRQNDLVTMTGRLADARLLAACAYQGTPTTLASDLSEQLRATTDVPAEAVRPMLIPPEQAKPIDAAAANWCGNLLDLKDGDAVAAMVYWFADTKTHSLLNGAEPEQRLTLVLIKFTPTRDPAQPYAISRIAWGSVDRR